MNAPRLLGAVLLAAFALGCGGRRKDTLVADTCRDEPPPWSRPSPSDDELSRIAGSVSHVVLGRLRWTGSAFDEEPGAQRELDYAVVDVLEFHRGDAWSVDPRMRRSFPLLADSGPIRELDCRVGEAFFFFVVLPGADAKPWPGGVPDPVVRAFGDNAVELVLLVPESERTRVVAAISKAP